MQDNIFDEYNAYKNEVLDILSSSYTFYLNQGSDKIANSIQDNIDVINSGEFEVVVVGEFSAGKSTFLNALMREKYLPSYTKETTATINYLRNISESDCPGIAYFFDGHTETLTSLDCDEVAKYVCTKNKEMKVEENIKHLDLFIDSPFLENKVTLIDSPGLNGMKQGLGDITDAQIKKSHAVIFMFSAEQSGKRSEFEYLKKIKDQVDTVFLVLNKIDCIKESENETVEDKIQDLIDSYKAVFPEDNYLPEIIPVAAYPALVARSKLNLDYPQNRFNVPDEEKRELEAKSLMGEFETKLLHFLTNSEKTVTQIREPMQRLKSIFEETLSKYEAEIETVESQSDGLKLQEQISILKTALSELENELNEQRGNIRKSVKNVERDTLEALDKELEGVRRQAKLNIEELDTIDALGDYFELLNRLIVRKLSEVVIKLDKNFRDNFFDAVQENYVGIISVLEDKMEDTAAGNVHFEVKINVNANSINAGIENFNSMKDELKHKMDELEERKKDLSVKEDQLIEMSYRSAELKSKLERLERSESELLSTFCPPEAIVTHKQGTRTLDRSGLFGKVVDFVKGKKTETYTYEETDDSERKEYISNFKAQQKQIEDKQAELERKLEPMAGTEGKLAKVSADREEVQKELARLRTEEKDMTERFDKELNQKYEKEVDRIKRRALADVEDYIDGVRPEIAKVLKANRGIYTEMLQDLVEQSVMGQIRQKREECENLIKLKEEANDNREAILTEKKELKVKVTELKEKADALLDRINSIEVDKIKYQSI